MRPRSSITLGAENLSKIVQFDKYARHVSAEYRRESKKETIKRTFDMHREKFPHIAGALNKAEEMVQDGIIAPSMRGLQFAGEAIIRNNSRIFNCAFLPIDSIESFSETMFLLLSGCGVGYSVEYHNIEKLPLIAGPQEGRRVYTIGDTIEGWSDSVFALLNSYIGNDVELEFDPSQVRKKGALLKTSGGRAPGPEPLMEALGEIEKILKGAVGRMLTSLEVHDICCFMAEAVYAGGIRRAALISLFSMGDDLMRYSKHPDNLCFTPGQEKNVQRSRANNSEVHYLDETTEEAFRDTFSILRRGTFGEPAVIWSRSRGYGFNPCVEASLRAYSFCNLVTINAQRIETQEDFNLACFYASLIGTVQASYTDFEYLRPIWKKTTDEDALIGVSMTAVAHNTLKGINLEEGARVVVETNKKFAPMVGVNQAARCTLGKPEGTSTLWFGASGSGIHGVFGDYYIRRAGFEVKNPLAQYFKENHPEQYEVSQFKPEERCFLTVPLKSDPGCIVEGKETALQFLERLKYFTENWVEPGHNRGINKNNISATCYVDEHEWQEVEDWVWNNRENLSGISFFPKQNHGYIQAPFEKITKEEYELRMKSLTAFDPDMVVVFEDDTELSQQVACAGNSCEY